MLTMKNQHNSITADAKDEKQQAAWQLILKMKNQHNSITADAKDEKQQAAWHMFNNAKQPINMYNVYAKQHRAYMYTCTGRPILVYVEIYILVDRNEYLFGPFTNYIIRKSWGEKLTSTKTQGLLSRRKEGCRTDILEHQNLNSDRKLMKLSF